MACRGSAGNTRDMIHTAVAAIVCRLDDRWSECGLVPPSRNRRSLGQDKTDAVLAALREHEEGVVELKEPLDRNR
jgi:hypothetical protein